MPNCHFTHAPSPFFPLLLFAISPASRILTGASQELFRCRIDAEVTEQQPYKLIPLEEIKQDFVNRAAVCDFHPFKEQLQVRLDLSTPVPHPSHAASITPLLLLSTGLFRLLQDYAGEEILIIYDADFKFGQNFVICLTEEAKATFLQVCPAQGKDPSG